MFKTISRHLAVFAAICGLLVPAAAQAGLVAVFGDINSMSDNTAARNRILKNLLGTGTRVVESKQNTAFPNPSGAAAYYSTLSGVTANVSSAEVTTSLLTGVNLLFLNIGCCNGTFVNPYSASEISVMAAFLQNGGTLGILEEPCCTDVAAVSGMNAMLASLGSSIRYTTWTGTSGTATMSGPLGTGVTNYQPTTFGVLTGGLAAAQVSGLTAIAYEQVGSAVPEPGMVALLGLGVLGLGLRRRRVR